ncbi:hypothetical protein HXX76_004179 [Chlamydomonas incerta]|uniref:Protein kinase domain-containing protein n=1 Tax=Chlamydomonas incerta TaxID=51695 RepID=A0A835W5E8_CHLIN|nr:hypothetical protein HXX76_004179 [Chlamydomonas incerta]|eukprot:KAG2440065.1 hypothetical protein HXX76_004179 [Chlamydomonas incerta]
MFTQVDSAAAAAKAPQLLWHSLDASRLLKPAARVMARSQEAAANSGLLAFSSTSRMLVLSQSCRVAETAAAAASAAAVHAPVVALAVQRDGGISNAVVSAQRTSSSGGVELDEELWLECVIGRGGFGVVYLGTWRGLPVAVKTLVVHEALLGEEGHRRQRAVLEAAVSSTLCHRNVVQTYAFDVRRLGELPGVGRGQATAPALAPVLEEEERGETEGQELPHQPGPEADSVYQLLLIQAYCEGGSLREGIVSGDLYMGLATDSLGGVLLGLCLALDVAAGMAHVHAHGIVHGDLSSGNVLLSARPAGVPAGLVHGAVENTTGSSASTTAAPSEGLDAPLRSTEAVATTAAAQAAAVEVGAWALIADVLQPPVMAKIADFGLSARMGEGQTHASNCWQGTPTYTAPEVAVEGRLGKLADVYGFGVMLLELLTGKTVGEGLLSMAAMMAPEGGGVGGAVLAVPGMEAHAAGVLAAAAPTLVPSICGCHAQLRS